MPEELEKTLVVIGGGAAGFFCAINAARMAPGLRVIILEKGQKLLSKVRVSGGGRCNVTHASFDIAEMANRYPRGRNFVKKSFHGFFTTDTIRWFGERGVALKTEQDGRMFPVTDSSETIIGLFMREANALGVEIKLNTKVEHVDREPGHFTISLERGNGEKEHISATAICVATGGFQKPEHYTWIRELGHSIVPPLPSLFTFNIPGHTVTSLMGISVQEANVRIPALKASESGPLLVTHWGLSGPAVLKLSAWCARELADLDYNCDISVNWLPAFNENTMLDYLRVYRQQHSSSIVMGKPLGGLPRRLWDFLAQDAGVKPDMRWSEVPATVQNRLAKCLVHYKLTMKGKTTFREEFVTTGGVNLSEINPLTMESRQVPGLFFAGEVMDVDGVTGGYNFQHAWTSGFLAAKAIAGL